MSPLLSLSHVSKSIGKVEILHDISLSVSQGEIFSIIGPNGAGKTTLLKIILGIFRASQGEVFLLGKDPSDLSVKKRIGFLPENPYFYTYLSGDEFLDFCGSFYHMEPALLRERKEMLLERINLIGARKKRLGTYSKGMLQRIGIAQALLHDPDIIFLDEPMSGLDPLGRNMIKNLLWDLRAQKKTIFFNSHILSDVEMLADRFALLAGGAIRAQKTIQTLNIPLEDFFLDTIQSLSCQKKS